MTVTYTHGSSLYVNVTNRCSNRCDFCVRTQADGYYSDSLWLEREPSCDEIISEIIKSEPDKFDSLVFCGYGEPTERLDDIIYVAKTVKKAFPFLPIRLNTNGQSDLICGKSTAPLFKDAFDTVSISLNAPDAKGYDNVCHSRFGPSAFDAILSFASELKKYVPNVVFSAVRGSISDDDLEKCKEVAKLCGIPLRIREYIKKQLTEV